MKKILNASLLALLICSQTACFSTKTEEKSKEIELTGSFQSTRGVMQTLSCYCYNGGYLTDANGKETPICFPKSAEEVSCQRLTVTGHFKTVENKPEPTSPCAAGKMTYFEVVSFKCL